MPKRIDRVPLRIVDDVKIQNKILKEFHNILWVRHKGVWATYHKIKEQYWWKGFYKDMEEFVAFCIEYQL